MQLGCLPGLTRHGVDCVCCLLTSRLPAPEPFSPHTVGLPILNGWGLSETSPVLACRRNFPRQNVRGSVGK